MMSYQYRGFGAISDSDRSPIAAMIDSLESQLAEINHLTADAHVSGSIDAEYAQAINDRVQGIFNGAVMDLHNGLESAISSADLERLKSDVRAVQGTVTELRRRVVGEGSIGGGQNVKKVLLWGGLGVVGAIMAGLWVARAGSTKKRRRRR